MITVLHIFKTRVPMFKAYYFQLNNSFEIHIEEVLLPRRPWISLEKANYL